MSRFVLVVLVVLSGCVRSMPAPDLESPPVELTLPSFPSRGDFSFASLRGSVVFVDLWASWCDPCRESLPRYQDMVALLPDVKMVAVSIDAEAAWATEVPRFVQEVGVRVPVLLDAEGERVGPLFKVTMMPTAVLLDRKGRVRHVVQGWDPDEPLRLRPKLEALLAEP